MPWLGAFHSPEEKTRSLLASFSVIRIFITEGPWTSTCPSPCFQPICKPSILGVGFNILNGRAGTVNLPEGTGLNTHWKNRC